MSEEFVFKENYEKLTPETPAHAERFNEIYDLLIQNDNFLKAMLETKIGLYIGETLPEIKDRDQKTLYFKVTDTISTSNINENIKVSPQMGIKLT